MALQTCSCGSPLKNFKKGKCDPTIGNLARPIFIPKEKNDGTLSGLDITTFAHGTQIPTATTDGLFYAQNQQDRWFILPDMGGYTPTKTDPNIFEKPDGTRVILREGIGGMEILYFVSNPHAWLRKFEAVRCEDWTVAYETDQGHITGKLEGGYFRGREISDKSMLVEVIEQNANENIAAHLKISWQYDRKENDSMWDYIESSTFETGLSTYKALEDVYCEIIAVGTDDIQFRLYTEAGGLSTRIAVENLDNTVIEAYNVTDSSVIDFTATPMDATTKIYTATYATQTVGKVIRVQGDGEENVQNNAFDFTAAAQTTGVVA